MFSRNSQLLKILCKTITPLIYYITAETEFPIYIDIYVNDLSSIFLLEGRDIHYFIPFLMIRIFLHKEINPAIIYHI